MILIAIVFDHPCRPVRCDREVRSRACQRQLGCLFRLTEIELGMLGGVPRGHRR